MAAGIDLLAAFFEQAIGRTIVAVFIVWFSLWLVARNQRRTRRISYRQLQRAIDDIMARVSWNPLDLVRAFLATLVTLWWLKSGSTLGRVDMAVSGTALVMIPPGSVDLALEIWRAWQQAG